MNGFLILFVGLIYLGIAISYFINGGVPLGVVFLGYSFSNYGLYLAGKLL